MRAPPVAVTQTNGTFCSSAVCTPRTKRSPTTDPIEPPMNSNSKIATTTGKARIETADHNQRIGLAGLEHRILQPVRVFLAVLELERVDPESLLGRSRTPLGVEQRIHPLARANFADDGCIWGTPAACARAPRCRAPPRSSDTWVHKPSGTLRFARARALDAWWQQLIDPAHGLLQHKTVRILSLCGSFAGDQRRSTAVLAADFALHAAQFSFDSSRRPNTIFVKGDADLRQPQVRRQRPLGSRGAQREVGARTAVDRPDHPQRTAQR